MRAEINYGGGLDANIVINPPEVKSLWMFEGQATVTIPGETGSLILRLRKEELQALIDGLQKAYEKNWGKVRN
jgi:hypothetical protein